MASFRTQKTLDYIIEQISECLPRNLKNALPYIATSLVLTLNTCNFPKNRHREWRPPAYVQKEPEEYKFALSIDAIHNSPYVRSIKKEFGSNYKNLKRAHQLAMLNIAYTSLRNTDMPNPRNLGCLEELLKKEYPKDSAKIMQIYDAMFVDYSTGIRVEDKFTDDIRRRIKTLDFLPVSFDFHAISKFLPFAAGDLARASYMIGGNIGITRTGSDYFELDFEELRKTKGWGRIKFVHDPIDGFYKAEAPDDMPEGLLGIGGFRLWKMKNMDNQVFVQEPSPTLKDVVVVPYLFPIGKGKDCYRVRFDIYGELNAVEQNNQINYSTSIVITNTKENLDSNFVKNKVDVSGEGLGFHLGFYHNKPICANPNNKEPMVITVGCEFTNKKTGEVVRGIKSYTIKNSEIPHYEAQLRYPYQKDSKPPIPNIAPPTKVEDTAKFVVPVTGAKLGPDSTKYTGNIDIYLRSLERIKTKVEDTAYVSEFIDDISKLEDSLLIIPPDKGIFPVKGKPLYLGSFEFNSPNPNSYAQLNIPMIYIDSKGEKRKVPSGTYEAMMFVTSGPNNKSTNTASMDWFIKK